MESRLFLSYRHHDIVWCGPDLQSSSSSSTVIITWWRVIDRNSEHNGNPASSATVLIRCILLHDTHEKNLPSKVLHLPGQLSGIISSSRHHLKIWNLPHLQSFWKIWHFPLQQSSLQKLATFQSAVIIGKNWSLPRWSLALFVIYSLHDGVCSLRYLQSSWLILVSLLSTIIMMESLLFVMYRHHDKVWCGPDLQSLSSSSTVIITWWRVIHRNSERT